MSDPTKDGTIPPRIQLGVDLARGELPGKIVEIGCGAGLACAPLVRNSVKSSYVGIDRSAVAQARFEARNLHFIEGGRARFVRADFHEQLDIDDATVGLAINVNAFWTNPPESFAAALRLLRAKASLMLIFEAPSDEKAASIAAILDSFEPTGFVRTRPGPTPDGRTVARTFRRAS